MKTKLTKIASAAMLTAMLGGLTAPANAANWLMLQGTESPGTAARAKVWGFIQTQYQKDYSDPHASADTYTPLKLIGPNFTSQEAFAVNRARIGVRGTGMPLDSKVNYFFLAEFGENGITSANEGATHVTDASITLNHIAGARVRMGLFKTPMAEEIYQGIALFEYINFTIGTNHLLNERFANTDLGGAPLNPQNPMKTGTVPNGFDRPVGAARDVGVQIFDTFKSGSWEHAYSFMIGNGNGLNKSDNDSNKDTYVYWSSEKVYSGKGPRRQGLKIFAWSINGKRTIDGDTATGSVLNEEHERKRSGVGVKYLKKPYRVTAEYIKAKGMIWLGPHKQNFDMNAMGGVGDGRDAEAQAMYVEGGWYIPNTNWELDLRYNEYKRLTDGTAAWQTNFKTTTYGTQYHFNKKSRLAINYEVREAETEGTNTALAGHLSTLGNRLSMQLTHIF